VLEDEDNYLPPSMLEAVAPAVQASQGAPHEAPDHPWFMPEQTITSLNVTALKAAIEAHGLKPKSNKPDHQNMPRNCMTN
jgi:hypothetical protein